MSELQLLGRTLLNFLAIKHIISQPSGYIITIFDPSFILKEINKNTIGQCKTLNFLKTQCQST